jgi:hypothetical protein
MTPGSSALAALTKICSCQEKWKIKDEQIQALQKAAKVEDDQNCKELPI